MVGLRWATEIAVRRDSAEPAITLDCRGHGVRNASFIAPRRPFRAAIPDSRAVDARRAALARLLAVALLRDLSAPVDPAHAHQVVRLLLAGALLAIVATLTLDPKRTKGEPVRYLRNCFAKLRFFQLLMPISPQVKTLGGKCVKF